ncbi:MFS transporter [Streptomyces sp. NPDC056468]|uniref:MFS transporter n=1 Tax=unclassified Streptomyces TaxID=2593676 RepID=UPI0036844C9B
MSTVADRDAVDGIPPLSRNRDFWLLWTGSGLSVLGSRAGAAGYALLVLWHTGSGQAAGLVAFAALLPNLVVQLPAGVLVDRWDRKRLMVACEIGRLLALLSVAVTAATGRFWLPHLMAVALVETSLGLVHQLGEQGAVRHVVAPHQLGAALARNETRFRAAGLVGGPLGTALFALTRWLPFAFAALGQLLSLLALLLIRREFQDRRKRDKRSLVREMREGVAWLLGQRFLRAAVSLVAATNVLFQVMMLAVPFALVEEDGRSPVAVGVVLAAGGIGGMLGALSAQWWIPRLYLRTVLIGGLALWALLVPLLAVVREPLLMGAACGAMSYVSGLFNVVAAVYQLRITPDELLGRSAGAAGMFAYGASALGALAGGVLLDAWGSRSTVLLVAALMAVTALAAAAVPAVRAAAHPASGDPDPGPSAREDDGIPAV